MFSGHVVPSFPLMLILCLTVKPILRRLCFCGIINVLTEICSVGRTSQLLTSWAQRQKLRPKKSKAEQAPSQIPEYQEQPHRLREAQKHTPLESADPQDQVRLASAAGYSHSCLFLLLNLIQLGFSINLLGRCRAPFS